LFIYLFIFVFSPEDEGQDDNGEECEYCGRKFHIKAFEKHGKVCKKVFQSKRKAFNSKNKRLLDSEHAMLLKQADLEEKKKSKMGFNKENRENAQEKAKKIPKWKMQSEQLRNQIKSIQVDTNNISSNGKNVIMVDQPKYDSTQYDGLTPCDLCNRRYNDDAYKRHLNMCQKKNGKDNLNVKNNNGNEKNNGINNNGSINGKNGIGIYAQKPNLNLKFKK